MIVNIQVFFSFLIKVNIDSESFDEVINSQCTRYDDDKAIINLILREKSKSPYLNFFRTIHPLKNLLSFTHKKTYQPNIYNTKNQINQLSIFYWFINNNCRRGLVNIL